MEARLVSAALIAVCFLSMGASHRTQNFIVTAASKPLAVEIGEAAERYRRDLAVEWLGKELPAWRAPCPITAQVSPRLGAGGATSFMFENNQPFGWTMNIQGSRERVLDSVLPHEITHTIFATHFGRPLPRWADEGACTTVEHQSERQKQQDMLIQFLTSVPSRGIAFNRMFTMTEYPRDVIPLYAQGHSVARFLLANGGKRKFMHYLADGMGLNARVRRAGYHDNSHVRLDNWTKATREHYGFESLSELQLTWVGWVRQGRPALADRSAERIARLNGSEAPGGVATVSLDQATAQDLSPVKPPRDRVAQLETGAAPKSLPDHPLVDDQYRPGSIKQAPPLQNVSRPQPMGRPEQRVLEWSRPPAPASSAGGSYYSKSRDTIRR